MVVPWFSLASRLPWIGKKLFLLADKKRGIALAAQAIADELDMNADEAERCEPHGSGIRPSDLVFRFFEWDTHGMTARALSHPGAAPHVWAEVNETYKKLRRTASMGSYPPLAAEIREIAERLRVARF